MTLNIYWTSYNSSYTTNIEKFTITGFRDFILEQARGLFKIYLNTFNPDVKVGYVILICGVYTTGNQSCSMHE